MFKDVFNVLKHYLKKITLIFKLEVITIYIIYFIKPFLLIHMPILFLFYSISMGLVSFEIRSKQPYTQLIEYYRLFIIFVHKFDIA